MEAAWLAAVILAPLFFDTYSARIFEPDKITLVRSLALLILGAWIVKLVDEGGPRWDRVQPSVSRLKTIFLTPMVIPAVATAGVYLLSTIFSVSPRVSFMGSYQRLQGTYTTLSYLVIFAAVLANLRRRNQVERLITTIILTSLPISIFGAFQRFHIDPIPWGADVSVRVASNLGNPIFVAAFLIMAFPLTLLRIWQSFDGILHDQTRRLLVVQTVRGIFYVFTAAMEVMTMYMSQSRGPALGLMVGIFIMALLLILRLRSRKLVLGIVGLGALGLLFLLVLNIQNGPLEALRNSPAVGRFGQILNEDSNNSKVRRYIWQGTARLVGIHAPLKYPDGSTDQFNFLRPIIGYGPESMYVAFNQFYVPALGQVEKRNASPDRAHNETWDSLVITGGLGFLAYLLVFGSVFYYALKWIGLICSERQRNQFIAFFLAGGLVGTIGMVLLNGVEYFGMGVPIGVLAGVILYVIVTAIKQDYQIPENPGELTRWLLLVALLGAVAAHFIEINFGIAIVTTRTYFWVYSALIVLVGYVLPLHNEYEAASIRTYVPFHVANEPVARMATSDESRRTPQGNRASRRSERLQQKRRSGGKGDYRTGTISLMPPWLRSALISALILAIILLSLGFSFIQDPNRISDLGMILVSSFTNLPNHDNAVSYGILALILMTWIAGAAVMNAESAQQDANYPWAPGMMVTLGTSGLVALVYYLWQAGALAAAASFVPSTVTDAIGYIDQVGSVLTTFYVFLFLILFVGGLLLPREWPLRSTSPSAVGILTAIPILLVFFILTNASNLQVIRADITFKMAEPYSNSGQWQVAELTYKHAHDQAPSEDYYYLFLGRAYLELAKDATTTSDQNNLVTNAEADLKAAQKLNPLNTDHTANLARLYSWWASVASDATEKVRRAKISDAYYSRALALSPNNSTLWGEWAMLYEESLNEPQQAYNRIQHALDLDPKYNWTLGLMADYYARMARAITDTVQRSQYYNESIQYYTQAISLTAGSDPTSLVSYWVGMGTDYNDMGQIDTSIAAFREAANMGSGSSVLYRIYEKIAELYSQKKDKTNAVTYAQKALDAAPKDQQSRLQQVLTGYQVMK